jgi:hypothetical protein
MDRGSLPIAIFAANVAALLAYSYASVNQFWLAREFNEHIDSLARATPPGIAAGSRAEGRVWIENTGLSFAQDA